LAEHCSQFCITNSTKTKGKTCPFLQIYIFNFYSQCWIGSFLVTDWLLGLGGTGQYVLYMAYSFTARGVTNVI